MQDLLLTIKENSRLTEKMFRMVLSGDGLSAQLPGQFVNVQINGLYLRRPISVCDFENNSVTIIYAVVGKGTKALSEMKPGETLSVLTGLGNGYDTSVSGDHPLLIGGGAGVPPMFLLAKKLIAEGKQVTVVLGFNTKSEVYYTEEFFKAGCHIRLATVDGSLGAKGFATDILPSDYSYVYTCGPEPMLKAVYKTIQTSGQFSFEERMGCGFGACMGCSCKTITGYKRICKDGPVLRKEEILWED
ncbi:MAG: dihydroorotate dehydrogenase electron transfer subunit [Parasporobacterium sp.]|nr:dihydroorotate dehydrogenase electron transfer subunit [Parasporobacterium sp.]MBR3244352.1 dihydroorotate dehydrogenase electron transfer subunit [Parasporobacterium sp.]